MQSYSCENTNNIYIYIHKIFALCRSRWRAIYIFNKCVEVRGRGQMGLKKRERDVLNPSMCFGGFCFSNISSWSDNSCW
jgi:hypothetical protein